MGTCKALLPYHGTTFVDRVVSVARSAVDEVVLLGNTDLCIPVSTGVRRLEDKPTFAGPLAGLVPLIEYAGHRWSLLIACDMPLIETKILQRLLDACDPTVDAAAFRVRSEHSTSFPCCAVFHPRVASDVRTELARSASLRSLIGRVRCRVVEAEPSEARCLQNFNTLEEYAALSRPHEELVTLAGCAR
jgi:molybdopterin-guanine dinucleotide biosynthesis protein A